MLSKNQLREIQALHQRKQRSLRRQFIAEGTKTVVEILQSRPEQIVSVFAVAEFIVAQADFLKAAQVNVQEVSADELQRISLQSTPNQVLAVVSFFEVHPVLNGNPPSFYLDDIRDPGNLGTIIRLSDWFGMPNLYCSPSTCELYNPKVIQSSMGSFLRVRVEYLSIEELQPRFTHIYGALLEGNNVFTEHLQSGLIVIGNEANGISEQTKGVLTTAIKIPSAQHAGAESLNAAMAASILAAEFFRQLS